MPKAWSVLARLVSWSRRGRFENPPPCGVLAVAILVIAGTVLHAQGQAPQRRVLAQIIAKPSGFEPAQMTIRARFVDVVVRNKTGRRTLDVRILTENGPQLRQSPVDQDRRAARERLELTPGRYVVTEASTPAWRTLIVVQP